MYHGTGFKTLVWIYWCQSVIIGLFNFLNLITVRSIIPGSIKINDEPVVQAAQARGCLAPFFAVHYGIFHFVYFIFLFTITDENDKLDLHFFQVSVAAFFVDQLWNFIRLKQWEKTHKTNAGALFFLPYVRIVPMHLTILLPGFLKGLSHLAVFLALKTVADAVTYVISMLIYGYTDDDNEATQLYLKDKFKL
jgi:hypothetical protein